MKKLIVIIGILVSFNSFSQIVHISDGESGLSVLNKFNLLIDYVNDPIFTELDPIYSSFMNDVGYLTNANEADPLFSNWNKIDGINIYSKQIIDKESLLEPYAFLTDITGGTIDADFTSVSINGNLIISFPGFTSLLADYSFTDNSTSWNDAYGWGNHASAGYLTSFTETDPIFVVSPANGITSTNITNWTTAYGWGDHASAGYLTSFNETDPIYSAWDKDYNDLTNTSSDTIEVFYAASSQTDYTLANNVQEEYTISQNGVILPPSVYSISTNILTINIGVYKNDRIQINYKYVKL
jgi:hypothetical protein